MDDARTRPGLQPPENPKRVSARTELELQRGRIIAKRAERSRDLDRYVAGKKVKIMVAMHGHPFYPAAGRLNLFYVADVCVGHQNIMEDDYPSEGIMAVIAMAVSATVGTDGIPPVMDASPEAVASRDLRNAYRDKHLGQWRQLYDQK